MAYVYILFGLLSSGVMEWYARIARLRAKVLQREIPQLVGSSGSGKLASWIGEHPLIRGIQVTPPYPTYIPPQHFALALIDLAIQQAAGPGGAPIVTPRPLITGTTDALTESETALIRSLIAQDTSIRTVQATIEKWFENSMERLSGAYKRRVYVILLMISLLIGFLFGIDSIHLAAELYSNQPLRAALAKGSQGLSSSILPIGWGHIGWTFIPGCILTGLALTLGTPFWFDLLGRVANLRQTGVPPDMKGKIVAQ